MFDAAVATASECFVFQQVWSHRSLISLVSMLAAIVVATCFVWSCLAGYLNRCAAHDVQPSGAIVISPCMAIASAAAP